MIQASGLCQREECMLREYVLWKKALPLSSKAVLSNILRKTIYYRGGQYFCLQDVPKHKTVMEMFLQKGIDQEGLLEQFVIF